MNRWQMLAQKKNWAEFQVKTKLSSILSVLLRLLTVSLGTVERWGLSYRRHWGPKNNRCFFLRITFFHNDGVSETFPTFEQEVGHFLLCVFFPVVFVLSFLPGHLFFLTFCGFFSPFIHSSPWPSFVAVAPLLLVVSHIGLNKVISCFVEML